MTPNKPPPYNFLDILDEPSPLSREFLTSDNKSQPSHTSPNSTTQSIPPTNPPNAEPTTIPLGPANTAVPPPSPLGPPPIGPQTQLGPNTSSSPLSTFGPHALDPSSSNVDGISQPTPSHPMITRARRSISKPVHRLNLHVTTESPTPQTHLQALKEPNWTSAMKDKFNALIANGT